MTDCHLVADECGGAFTGIGACSSLRSRMAASDSSVPCVPSVLLGPEFDTWVQCGGLPDDREQRLERIAVAFVGLSVRSFQAHVADPGAAGVTARRGLGQLACAVLGSLAWPAAGQMS